MKYYIVTATFPLLNKIELKADDGKVYYYKFFCPMPHDLYIGDRFSLLEVATKCNIRFSKLEDNGNV